MLISEAIAQTAAPAASDEQADAAPDGEPGDGALPADPAAPRAVDAALLGRQVGLAQRIVDEKPDDALHALRKMLANPEPENAR